MSVEYNKRLWVCLCEQLPKGVPRECDMSALLLLWLSVSLCYSRKRSESSLMGNWRKVSSVCKLLNICESLPQIPTTAHSLFESFGHWAASFLITATKTTRGFLQETAMSNNDLVHGKLIDGVDKRCYPQPSLKTRQLPTWFHCSFHLHWVVYTIYICGLNYLYTGGTFLLAFLKSLYVTKTEVSAVSPVFTESCRPFC